MRMMSHLFVWRSGPDGRAPQVAGSYGFRSGLFFLIVSFFTCVFYVRWGRPTSQPHRPALWRGDFLFLLWKDTNLNLLMFEIKCSVVSKTKIIFSLRQWTSFKLCMAAFTPKATSSCCVKKYSFKINENAHIGTWSHQASGSSLDTLVEVI